MAQWIRIEQDDAALLSVVINALQSAGYAAEPAAVGAENADLSIACTPVATKTASLGEFVVDLDSRTIVSGGEKELHFTPTEWDVLVYLLRNAHRTVPRAELLTEIWELPADTVSRVADDTVKRLRRKLASCSVAVETVWGIGFRLTERKWF